MTARNPLIEALDHAAPDGESWMNGFQAYTDKLAANGTIEEAYYASLDAAAPDKPSWFAGEAVLVLRGQVVKSEPDNSLMARIGRNFKTLTAKGPKRAPTTHTEGHS